jgi:hypothetical protein
MPKSINTSATSPAFIITPRIASKITAHLDSGLGLKSYNVQSGDVIRAPFGLQNRPYHTHQQAIDALAQYQAHSPDKEYSINQGGLCYDYYLLNENWQETLADTNPFERAWLLQIIADCLNAFTLPNDCTHQDYLDASQACFATADAIEPLLASFTPDQHSFRDAMAHYATQGNSLYQASMSAEMEVTA